MRERVPEIGVLKTLGFSGSRVTGLVLAESCLLTLLGAATGMAVAGALVDGVGEVVRRYLPVWSVPAEAWLNGLGIALLLGLIAGAIPALQALRLPIVRALRGH